MLLKKIRCGTGLMNHFVYGSNSEVIWAIQQFYCLLAHQIMFRCVPNNILYLLKLIRVVKTVNSVKFTKVKALFLN